MKLFISPNPKVAGDNNGVGRVVKAQYDYLPARGFEFVNDPQEADIVACHIQGVNLPRVDVHHVHGLEWSGDGRGYNGYHSEVNRAILDTARRAWAVTVPSEWVAMPFKRDMRLNPVVIGHGIDLAEWEPLPVPGRETYALWNKNRQDAACNPEAANELGKRGIPVITTFGDERYTRVIGPQPFETMKEYVRHAGVYLSTAKETFGIGLIEALAAGVPVLSWATGGALDLVRDGYNGRLVEPGDYDGMAQGYQWLIENLPKLSYNARESAQEYDWQRVIGQYAALYREVWREKQKPRNVAVVVTNFNYKEYVGDALQSAIAQSLPPAEVVVVDDGSTDGSLDVIRGSFGNRSVRVIQQENMGVAQARNNGIAATSAEYIVCLDADDWLDPAYLERCYRSLEADRGLGVAYTGLMMHFSNGEAGQSGWPPEFDFDGMAKVTTPPSNSVPCAAMFRREMWERSGGYRQEHAPGEDAEFFLRGTSLGFRAKRVTNEPLFHYRLHEGSHSKVKKYKPVDRWHPWMRDRLYPMAAPTKRQTPVLSYSDPLVSVIIPVGPGHAKYLPEALNSLTGQTWRRWEAIVVMDGATDEWDALTRFLEPYPFVTLLYTARTGKRGAGYARNMGLEAAKAPLTLWLDADDWLAPNALEEMLKAYATGGGRYVYSDWIAVEGPMETHQGCLEYDPMLVLDKLPHAVTALMSTEDARHVGGFDSEMKSWEDWDFFAKCAVMGIHGKHLAEPLLYYRVHTGTRRKIAQKDSKPLFDLMEKRYGAYRKGEQKIMSCCGGRGKADQMAQQAYQPQAQGLGLDPEAGKVQLEFTGVQQGGVPFTINGTVYVGANNPTEKYVNALPGDVDRLLQTGLWRLV